MVDTEHPLAHQHGPLLVAHRLPVIAHDVVESRQQAAARRDLRVHSTVHVVEKVQGFRNKFVALAEEPLLDFLLTGSENLVRICSLGNESQNGKLWLTR